MDYRWEFLRNLSAIVFIVVAFGPIFYLYYRLTIYDEIKALSFPSKKKLFNLKSIRKHFVRYKRYYTLNDLKRGADYYNYAHTDRINETINVTENKNIIRKIWDKYISKCSCFRYYVETDRVVMFIKHSEKGLIRITFKPNGEYFTFMLCNVGVCYDIYHVLSIRLACPEFADWLTDISERFYAEYEQDKNL